MGRNLSLRESPSTRLFEGAFRNRPFCQKWFFGAAGKVDGRFCARGQACYFSLLP